MASSTWVGDLARKFRQGLQEVVDSSLASELTAASLRGLIADLRGLVNAVGLEALVQRVEQEDEAAAVVEVHGERLRYRGREEKEWLTPFGKAKVARRRYARQDGGLSVVPLDEACGMTGQFMTPEVREMVAFSAALMTAREVEQLLGKALPEGPSATAVQRVVHDVGDVLHEHEASVESRVRKNAPLSKAGDILVASWDGVMTPIREEASTAWREAGVAAVSVYGEGKEGPEKRDTRYLARMPEKGMKTLIARLEHLVADLRKKRRFREFVVLCDGKDTIWNIAKKSSVLRPGTFILDFYHAADYLADVAKAIYGDGERARRWFRRRRDQLQLDADAVNKIIRSMRRSLRSLRPGSKRHDVVRRAIAHFRENRKRMRYTEFIARGLPIGSGPVEAAAKNVVAARLKRCGMRWSLEGGQHVLDLRAFVKSNRWETMWDAYLEAA